MTIKQIENKNIIQIEKFMEIDINNVNYEENFYKRDRETVKTKKEEYPNKFKEHNYEVVGIEYFNRISDLELRKVLNKLKYLFSELKSTLNDKNERKKILNSINNIIKKQGCWEESDGPWKFHRLRIVDRKRESKNCLVVDIEYQSRGFSSSNKRLKSVTLCKLGDFVNLVKLVKLDDDLNKKLDFISTSIKSDNTFKGLLKKMNLKKVKVLGKGGYGEVSEYKINNKKFAVKENTKECEKIEKVKGKILKGNALSLEYKHKNVLNSRSIIVYRKKEKLFLNIEKKENIENGDIIKGQIMKLHGENLCNKLKNEGVVNKYFLKKFGKQIASGIKYLHDNGQVHGDIKLENVLIKKDKIKINDYDGVIKYKDIDKNQIGKIIGTAHYISPETLYSKEVLPANDCWAFGIMLFAMTFGNHAFEVENMEHRRMHNRFEFKGHPSFEEYAKNHACLKKNPALSQDKQFWSLMNQLICHKESRLSMKEVLEHPFFK